MVGESSNLKVFPRLTRTFSYKHATYFQNVENTKQSVRKISTNPKQIKVNGDNIIISTYSHQSDTYQTTTNTHFLGFYGLLGF